jgi:hypothetical protein
MWWFIKATLVMDRSSIEYFGLFPERDVAKEYADRVFDPEDVDVEFLEMVTVYEANANQE